MGIDIGKNSFHVIDLDRRGAIVLRQKWSRSHGLLRHDRLSSILEPLRRVRKEAAMWSIRNMVMTGAAIIAAGPRPPAKP
jgi:hypothetical protein